MKTPLIALLIVFAGLPLLSQPEGAPTYEDIVEVYEDLFSAQEPLYLTLKLDVDAFRKTRNQDVYQEAEMTQVASDGIQVSHPVQLRASETIRGKICNLPPMWLKIGNSEINADALPQEFRMNMVLRCKDPARYEQYVLREYLAYKLYNAITPLSYQVRLVRLTMVDTGKGNEVTEDWAFLQEPDELMTLRLNSIIVNTDRVSIRTANPEIINSLSMFQYMIGNADYSVTGQHNLKILALKEYGPTGFIPVPYGFDYSGLVNTDYAVPGEALGTTSIRERYYLGPCRPEKVHNETIQELAQFYDKIMACIKDFEYLDDKEKDDMIGYLDSYFKESKESWFIDQKIAPTCR